MSEVQKQYQEKMISKMKQDEIEIRKGNRIAKIAFFTILTLVFMPILGFIIFAM